VNTIDQRASQSDQNRLTLRVVKTTQEATGIMGFELADPNGGLLPSFNAGAHIDVWISETEVRSYSLCGDPSDTSSYKIGVLREEQGEGGSIWVHDHLSTGESVNISAPKNLFPLSNEAEHHVLLAGGIGVTPMIAMIHELESKGASYVMHLCVRSADRTPFMDFLSPRVDAGKVQIHHDGGNPEAGLDIADLLKHHEPGSHLYYCGPAGFMDAAKSASSHWPKGTVHFEFFSSPDDGADQPAGADMPFQVKLTSSDEVYDVPADQSIVDVLRANGISVDTQCEDGFCGTCMTKYVSGEPEHRDSVLDEDDQKDFVLICCARSKTPLLELDL
jgi:ferredoxin-NADP reductase